VPFLMPAKVLLQGALAATFKSVLRSILEPPHIPHSASRFALILWKAMPLQHILGGEGGIAIIW
jgi:hypothetical protein